MESNASAALAAEELAVVRPGPTLGDHTIVPIWSFALFLLAYLLVSATIRRRYRWRRKMIESVLRQVEQARARGEEVHWPQPRPRAKDVDDKDSPVTPPKDPSYSPKKGGQKKKKKKSSKSSKSLRESALERSISDSGGVTPNSSNSGGTFEVEDSTEMSKGSSTSAPPGASAQRSTTFDVDESVGRAADPGKPARDSNALVRSVTAMDMGPGAAPEDAIAAEGIQSEIETEREKESRLPACQRCIRHLSGNLEGLLLVQEFGVEAGSYLALLWIFARFFLCLSILEMPLAWFYYKYGDRQNADLSCFTAANLPAGSPETAATAIATCMVLVASQGCCLYVWSRLSKLKYATKEARQEALLSGSTLMIDGLPNDVTKDDRLVEFLEQLVPGWIKTAHVALDLEDLIHVERKLAAARHEHSRAVESRSSCGGAGRVRKMEKLVSKLEREEEETRTTELKGTGIAFVTFQSLRRAMEFKRAISVREIPHLDASPASATAASAAGTTGVESKSAETVTKEAPASTLSSSLDAEALNLFGWKIEVAPDPSDILWENLRITPDSRKRRRRSSRALLFSTLLFGSALVLLGVFFLGFHYVNLVYNIEPAAHVTEGLSQVGDGLAEVFGSAYWLVFLAPPAVFLGLIASVPMIAKKLIAIEKHFTRSAVMQSYVAKSFAFYLLLNLVLTSCSWVVIVTQSEGMDGQLSKMQMFADLSGTFHICVVLTEAFVMAPHRMYRGWNLHSGVKCVALRAPSFPTPALPFNPTLKSDEMDDDAVLLFDFSKQYAEIFSIFAMLLAYGPLVPCVLPAGWLYFEILYATDQQVLRQQFAKHRTEDKRIRTITSHIQWCAVAAQLVPFIFIVVHGTEMGVAMLSVMALWTLLTYMAYIDRADNNGHLFYNKMQHCSPCVRAETRSARAGVSMSLTSSDTDSFRATVGGDATVEGGVPSRNFAQLSLGRTELDKQEPRVDGSEGLAIDVPNPLDPDDGNTSPTVEGGADHLAAAQESPYSHPLEKAVSGDPVLALESTVAPSSPSTFEQEEYSGVRPTPLVLDSNGDKVDRKARKKKRLEGLSLRRKKVDMTPASGNTISEVQKADGEVPSSQSRAMERTMTEFRSTGKFPKRGKSLMVTTSAEYEARRFEPENSADAFHLGQSKLLSVDVSVDIVDTGNKDGDNDGSGDQASFSVFDDMLATTTVGK